MKYDTQMVKRLILKDWDLHRRMISGYIGGGIVGIAILGIPHIAGFYMGAIILLTIMISAGFHAIAATILQEKKEQTIPFIMSLPIRPVEFSLAKVLANLAIFLVPWLAIVVGFTFLIVTSHIPDGLLVLFWVISTLALTNYALVLCVAIITESEGWSIFTMVMVNLLLNPVIMLSSRHSSFNAYFKTDQFVMEPIPAIMIMGFLTIFFASILSTLWRQSRRRTFI